MARDCLKAEILPEGMRNHISRLQPDLLCTGEWLSLLYTVMKELLHLSGSLGSWIQMLVAYL